MTLECAWDVVVIGAGPAGVGAALAAAETGATTLLVERYGAPGGCMALGLALTPVGFESFNRWTTPTDPDGWKVQGVARKLHDRCEALGGVVKPVWDPEVYKWVVDQMLGEAGVRVLYHATAVDTHMEGDRVVGVTLAAREGLIRVDASIVVDCSGDGDVLVRAGAKFELGRPDDGLLQPMALAGIFGGLSLGGVAGTPYPQLMEYSMKHVAAPLQAAVDAGEVAPVMSGYWFPRVVRGRVLLDQAWTRLALLWGDPTQSDVLSAGEIEARRVLHQVHGWLRENVRGFERSYVSHVSAQVWPRESRRLVGVETVDEAAVRGNVRRDDGIAKGTCFLEVRSPIPGSTGAEEGLEWDEDASLFDADVEYDIPYGALLPAGVDGLLVAGRCQSSTHVAHGSTRMQITVMACGEAAGTAAALSAASGRQPRELKVQTLRQALRKRGAIV